MLCISDDLGAVAVNDAQGNGHTGQKIPVVSMLPPAREIRYFSRLSGLFGLSLKRSLHEPKSSCKKLFGNTRSRTYYASMARMPSDLCKPGGKTDLPCSFIFMDMMLPSICEAADQPEKTFSHG